MLILVLDKIILIDSYNKKKHEKDNFLQPIR